MLLRVASLSVVAAGLVLTPSSARAREGPSIPSQVCWLSQGNTTCRSRESFAHALDPVTTHESTSVAELESFRRTSQAYHYPGHNFDRLVSSALERIGGQLDTRVGRGSYILTRWRYKIGPRRLLRTWKQRVAYSALVYRDLYSPSLFRVNLGCSIEQSPNGRDWEVVNDKDTVENAIASVSALVGDVIERGGGTAVQ